VPGRRQQTEAMMAELRDYLNLRYNGEGTVATEIGVESSSLADWLVGESTSPESSVKIPAFYGKPPPRSGEIKVMVMETRQR
jgi:hypothetical protein